MAVLAIGAAGVLISLVPSRIQLDSNIVAGLPTRDQAIADTLYVINQHEALDAVYIDFSLTTQEADPNVLVSAAEELRERLAESGLFLSVGTREYGEGVPRLLVFAASHLPLLFEEGELDQQVAEFLHPESIRKALQENASLLNRLEGIGQAGMIARDPLGLRHLILARLASFLPSKDAQILKGHILSADERHLLLPAYPRSPSTDTVFASRLASVIDDASSSLIQEAKLREKDIRILPVGAFQHTLDNEKYSRSDARRAAWISVLGIALLLFLCFPRPHFGLLCLAPALAGTLLALLTLSLFDQSISILALGFGGALIGIALDQGIAYLVFLDREWTTTGWEASRSVWVVSLASTLTTVGSFLALQLSGFPVLRQMGLFVSLGVFYSFLFVHLVFPLIFSSVVPARRRLFLRLESLTSPQVLGDGRLAAGLVLLLFGGLALFAKPRFQGDLKTLNTVSPETLRAEEHLRQTWGDIIRSVFLMVEGDSLEEMRRRSDKLASFLQDQTAGRKVSGFFTPSLIIPGGEATTRRRLAWQRFWTSERIDSLRDDFRRIQAEYGFAEEAFAPFFCMLKQPSPELPVIPEEFLPLLGVSRSRDGTKWMSLCPVVEGPEFDRQVFYLEAKKLPGIRVLDYTLFADRFAGHLVSGFFRMLLICSGGLALVLLFFFCELTLPLLILGHTVFALVCTLGTLNIIGQPLNIPGLAVAIIIPGIGSDYAIFFTRSYQHFLNERDSSLALFRNAVFLSAATTMIGFGALAVSHHVLLQNIGLTGLLAIGYSALGAFVLFPPLLRRILVDRPWAPSPKSFSPRVLRSRVRQRFLHLEPYPRQFARFKMLLDPMFPRLRAFVPQHGRVLDIGCGYGVPGAWLLAQFPQLQIDGFDPDIKRVRVAGHVFGARGTASLGRAPDLPPEPARWDAVLMLDVVHFLSPSELQETLAGLATRLQPCGRLVIRATVSSSKKSSWMRHLQNWRLKRAGKKAYYRSAENLLAVLDEAGFCVEIVEPSAPKSKEIWIVSAAPA